MIRKNYFVPDLKGPIKIAFMDTSPHGIIDFAAIAAGNTEIYKNVPLTLLNDHIIRLSIMTEPFYWHNHPNSDETFLGIEGTLLIELDDETIELSPGQLLTCALSRSQNACCQSSTGFDVWLVHG